MNGIRGTLLGLALLGVPAIGRAGEAEAGPAPKCRCAVELREFTQRDGRELPWLHGSVTPKQPTTRVANEVLATLTCEHAETADVRQLELQGDEGAKVVYSAWVRLTSTGRALVASVRAAHPDVSAAVVCDGMVVGAVRLDQQLDEGVPLGLVDGEATARALARNLAPEGVR